LILLAASSAALSQAPAPSKHKDLKAKIFFGIGGPEARSAGNEDDMVGDLKEFDAALKSHRYPGLQITSNVFADEDHLSVGPMIMTRGLKWALPPTR